MNHSWKNCQKENQNFIDELVKKGLFVVVHSYNAYGIEITALDSAFAHRQDAEKEADCRNNESYNLYYWVDSLETRKELAEKFAHAMVGCSVEGYSEDFELEARRHIARLNS